jgi:hypothetical protein
MPGAVDWDREPVPPNSRGLSFGLIEHNTCANVHEWRTRIRPAAQWWCKVAPETRMNAPLPKTRALATTRELPGCLQQTHNQTMSLKATKGREPRPCFRLLWAQVCFLFPRTSVRLTWVPGPFSLSCLALPSDIHSSSPRGPIKLGPAQSLISVLTDRLVTNLSPFCAKWMRRQPTSLQNVATALEWLNKPGQLGNSDA